MKTKFVSLLMAFLIISIPLYADDTPEKPKRVKAIDWNELAKCIPDEVEGMEVGELDGGTMSMASPTDPSSQFSYSNVERDYTSKKNKDKTITLHILDTGFNQFLMAPMMIQMEYDSPKGSMKLVEIDGCKGILVHDKKKGKITGIQLMLLVSERIMVTAEADENSSADEVKEMVKLIDFEKLAKLAE